jgi:tRNA G18 (ribose-2'-O)-methylase SpoU
MVSVQPLESFDLPGLEPYRTMRRQLEHCQQGIFVAEGEKVVERLLASPFPVLSAVMPAACFERLRAAFESRPEMIPVYLGDKPMLEQMTGFSMYQGVMAVGQIPALSTLDQVIKECPAPHFFAAVDGITNAENMGALVRSCVAFGAQALVVSETCCSPFLRRAVRNSMGAVFKLPVVETHSFLDALRKMRAQGMQVVAAHPHDEKNTLYNTRLDGNICVLFGSEGDGLSPEILQECDRAISIPMAHEVDSLNVACAGAVFMYEISRQRRIST